MMTRLAKLMLNKNPDSKKSDIDVSQPSILGFDPGRQKCGLAVLGNDRTLYWHGVVLTPSVVGTITKLCQTYPISRLVMGNQTSAQAWSQTLHDALSSDLEIIDIDERYSTLNARDLYWQMFPPRGFRQLIPQKLRTINRPIDDIAAIILVERYLEQLDTGRVPE